MTDLPPPPPVRGIIIHDPDKCAGRPCCYHNPSSHPMRDYPLHTRIDNPIYTERPDGRLQVDYLTERTCPHGIGHPDPDALTYLATVLGEDDASSFLVHGCDGCCAGSYA